MLQRHLPFDRLVELDMLGPEDSAAYRVFPMLDVNPLSGRIKHRYLHDPNAAMRQAHALFMHDLRAIMRFHRFPHATGARKKASPTRNVMYHCHNRWFYLTDLHNAFPSVDGQRLAQVLCEARSEYKNREQEVYRVLQRFFLAEKGGVATGGPASPDLFNIYAGWLLDRPLGTLAHQREWVYTRYLDDLTFSSRKGPIDQETRREIRRIIAEAGFTVSHRKSEVLDLAKGPITINGIGLELGGRIFIPQAYTRKLRGMLHRAISKGDVPPAKIFGMMGLFRSITGGELTRRGRTQTEWKIIRLYWEWLRNHHNYGD